MSVPVIYLESPQGDETKEVEATAAILTPYLAAGWHQVPAPTSPAKPVAAPKEAN